MKTGESNDLVHGKYLQWTKIIWENREISRANNSDIFNCVGETEEKTGSLRQLTIQAQPSYYCMHN